MIFVNDIASDINSIIRLFADDTSLVLPSIDLNTDLDILQNDLDKILQWAKQWAVTFNSSKTKVLQVSRRNTPTNINLSFDNTILSLTPEHKHLGITFNTSATWNNHLDLIIGKANKRLGILTNLKYSLNREALMTLYTAYARSILEYGDVVWDSIPLFISN